MRDQILLINDMCGYGKVAIAAMLPVLSHMGFRLHNLPTALVSNTLDYPKFYIQDTTDYIAQSLAIWDELGFRFDAISSGFIAGERQAELIASYCARQAACGVSIFVDPIMGDEGKLYAGVPASRIDQMRRLISVADYTVPNYTEACLLTDTPIEMNAFLSHAQAHELVNKIRALGAKSVIVTSANVDGKDAVVGYDVKTDEYLFLPFEKVPTYFPGTGDIFSSVVLGRVMKDVPLTDATQAAMDVVRELIVRNIDQADRSRGLPIEANLDLFPPRAH